MCLNTSHIPPDSWRNCYTETSFRCNIFAMITLFRGINSVITASLDREVVLELPHIRWALTTDTNHNTHYTLKKCTRSHTLAYFWGVITAQFYPYPSRLLRKDLCNRAVIVMLLKQRWRIWVSRLWWRHQMETFPLLLALCEGNPPVTGGFPS